MGGKRPDQYRIDPSEAGATDYKNLPQTGQGNSSLDDTVELDRQKVAGSEQEAASHPAPGARPAPSADVNRALRRQAEEELDPDAGPEETPSSPGNPLV